MLLGSNWRTNIFLKFFLSVELNYLLIFSPAHSSVTAVVNYRKVSFGGVNQNPQKRALNAGIDILVATPGRLLDLEQQKALSLKHIDIEISSSRSKRLVERNLFN